MTWTDTDYTFNNAQNATSAPTFTGIARPSQLVVPALTDISGLGIFNVKFYGAVCDGVTDDTAAVQAAYNALAAAGKGTLFIPGVCAVSSTIGIGNGSFAGLSTVNSVSIVGIGSGGGQISSATQKSGLKWIGASGGTVLQINGPIYGLRFEGLLIDGNNGLAAIGIQEMNVATSSFRDVFVTNCKQINWWRLGTANAAGGGNIGPAYTKYDNCGVVISPSLNGASSGQPLIGLCWGGNPNNPYDYAPSTNATNWGAYEGHYYDFAILMYGSNNCVGLDLRNCDHNYMDGGFIVSQYSVRCSPNPNANGFPQGNRFTRADWQGNPNTPTGSHIATNGTFVQSNTADMNYVEFLDNGYNYPGNSPGFHSWPLLPWLAGKTGTGIHFSAAGVGGGSGVGPVMNLRYVDRAGTSTVANTLSMTAFSDVSYSIPANALNQSGALLRIKAAGTFALASGQIRFQISVGGVIVFDTLLNTPTAASGVFQLLYDAVTKFGGATARLVYNQSEFSFSNQTKMATNDSTTASSPFDATSAAAVQVLCGFSSASPSNNATLTSCTVEIEYPPGDRVS